MIADKVSLCITLILVSRFDRGTIDLNRAARKVYESTTRSLIDRNNITPADFEKAFLMLMELESRKPTVQMRKVRQLESV